MTRVIAHVVGLYSLMGHAQMLNALKVGAMAMIMRPMMIKCQRCDKKEATHSLQFDIDLPRLNFCNECSVFARFELMKGQAYGGCKAWRDSFKGVKNGT